MYYLNKVKCYK